MMGWFGWYVELMLLLWLYWCNQYVMVLLLLVWDLIVFGVDSEWIVVVCNGFDEVLLLMLFGLCVFMLCVVVFFWLVLYKQIEDVLVVVVELQFWILGLYLDIVGGGWWWQCFVDYVYWFDIVDVVIFYGYVDDVIKYYVL